MLSSCAVYRKNLLYLFLENASLLWREATYTIEQRMMNLSILIPSYNWDCTELVNDLLAQLPEDAEIIVGNDKTKKLTRWAEVIEKKQGKPINYVIMTPDDYLYRKNVRDRFITDIFEMEITEIIDPENIIK